MAARRYLHGPLVDQVLAQEDLDPSTHASTGVLWHLGDHQNTTRDLVDFDDATADETTLVEHFVYDSFGRVESGDVSLTRYLYTGREWDAAVDLQYNRARWYDPAVGRWVSEDPIGFAAGDENLTRYVGNGATNSVDPSGLEVHHPYPLHLGGSNSQTGIDIPQANHNAAHQYLADRGYGFGDEGRTAWKQLPLDKQRSLIRGSLKAAGVKPGDINRLMKDAFKGACPGTKMPRTTGHSSFLKNAIKGAIVGAVITAPYEVYASTAQTIQAFGERVVLAQRLQWLIGSSAHPGRFPTSFIYHFNGEDYNVRIVNRGPVGREYIIAYTIRGEGADADIYWGVRDDMSCPLTR